MDSCPGSVAASSCLGDVPQPRTCLVPSQTGKVPQSAAEHIPHSLSHNRHSTETQEAPAGPQWKLWRPQNPLLLNPVTQLMKTARPEPPQLGQRKLQLLRPPSPISTPSPSPLLHELGAKGSTRLPPAGTTPCHTGKGFVNAGSERAKIEGDTELLRDEALPSPASLQALS